MSADARAKIREFIKNNFLLGNDKNLKDDDSFMSKGIVDSTGILELILFIEESWAVRVPPEDMTPGNFDSLDAIGHYLDRRLAA